MKTEKKMLPNGNFEEVVSFIQHDCTKGYTWRCVETRAKHGLWLYVEGDAYEDSFEEEIEVNFCPFCGYQPEKLCHQ